MTQPRMLGILAALSSGATEIYVHPATSNSFPEAAPRYRYVDELSALISPEVVAAMRASGAEVGGFSDLS